MCGIICARCGKYIWHVPDGGWGNVEDVELCSCKKQHPNSVQQGWQCPICGAVYAPWVASCGNPHIKLTYSTSTEKNK